MTASRRPPRTAGRSAKPDSLRAAHQQITRNNGTLADIADLIELEGKAHPARLQPGQPSRAQPGSGKPGVNANTNPSPQGQAKASGDHALEHHPFGIPVLAILLCALIVGAAVGVPLGVLTYGTAIYSAVMDSLAVF